MGGRGAGWSVVATRPTQGTDLAGKKKERRGGEEKKERKCDSVVVLRCFSSSDYAHPTACESACLDGKKEGRGKEGEGKKPAHRICRMRRLMAPLRSHRKREEERGGSHGELGHHMFALLRDRPSKKKGGEGGNVVER